MDYLRVSYSSMNVAASCWRKFEFQKLYPKRARNWDDTYAADVGKALHAGIQEYLIHGDAEKATWSFMQAFPYEGEFQQEKDDRSFEACLATLEEMFRETRLGDYELAKIVRPPSPKEIAESQARGLVATSTVVPAIEVPFELRFKGITLPDGRGIAFNGFIDAIMHSHTSGLFQTMDVKTSRMKLRDSTPKYKFDSQQVPYGIVVEHVAGQPIEKFEVLYLDCYLDLVEPKVSMYPFTKTQQDIQEWITNKVLQFESIQRFMAADYFPRTDGGCTFFNRACPYLEPCISRDRDSLTTWFLLDEEPAPEEEFHPWIVADIDVGVAA